VLSPISNPAGSYAAGNYEFFARVGVHPGDVWAEDSFPFTKSGNDAVAGFVPFVPDGVPDPFDRIDMGEDLLQPSSYAVAGVYPNPFNPITTLRYNLPEAGKVRLAVYDISGRQVAELVNGWRDRGPHELTFDASDLSSGVYIYRLNAGEFTASGKMVLTK
jgi:hypothetical protein